jgi:hypothetical protein
MWPIFSTRKSFSTYTYQFFWFVVEKHFLIANGGVFLLATKLEIFNVDVKMPSVVHEMLIEQMILELNK